MKVIFLLAELLPCLFIGYLLGKYKQHLSLIFARQLIKLGIPISLMGLLLKTGLDLPLVEAAAMALVSIGLLMTILNCLPIFRVHDYSRTLLLGSGFGNTGYLGIPVSLALLPSDALIYSIGFDLGATLVIWSLGPLILTKLSNQLSVKESFQKTLQAVLNSPATKGLGGALIVQATPWNEEITSFLWIPSRIVIVLALVVVGMRLGLLRTSTFFSFVTQVKSIKNSLLVKLIGFPILMLSLCLMLQLPKLMLNALVLQAAAPTAISILLIAQATSQDEEKATLLVILSTLMSLITIPIWSLVLQM